jgi:hypothetical protein
MQDELDLREITMPAGMKDRVRRFIEVDKERRQLEARLKEVKTEHAALAAQIQTDFDATGTQHERVDGMTVYVAHTLWARPKDGDQARLCAALRSVDDADLSVLVEPRVNIQTLSALARERLNAAAQEGRPESSAFPQPVWEALDISVDTQVKAVRGSAPAGR